MYVYMYVCMDGWMDVIYLVVLFSLVAFFNSVVKIQAYVHIL